MDTQKEETGMLDLMVRPGFRVKDNIILQVNSAAESLLITPGTDVTTLLCTGAQEYAAFTGGCLYLQLNLAGTELGATVIRLQGEDIFLLDQQSDDAELRIMALAARELRDPLSSVMLSLNQLKPLLSTTVAENDHVARLNRGLNQILRIIGNMSDAGQTCFRPEVRNVTEVFAEIFEKAQALTGQSGIVLQYQGLEEAVFGLADRDLLERATLNMLSNAIKYTETGGSIQASLTRKGRMLRLSITDSGSGLAENLRSSLFRRYLRQPGIEDGRQGLGLGMVLIRNAASCHGGTVLVDQPEEAGTRVTLTMTIQQNGASSLRSPVMRVDYAGERDHMLVELSDCLPLSAYKPE